MTIPAKRLGQMAWRNIGLIRSTKDQEFARQLLEARRDFLRLRARHEIALRKVYIDAAGQVARDLRNLKPTIGELTRNHLMALEKSLSREAEKIQKATQALTRSGMEQAVGLGARPIDNHLTRAIREADVGLDFLKLQRGFGDINTAAVEALWARTHKGFTVSKRIWNHTQAAKNAMRDLVHTGVATGRDVVKVARDLERYVRQGARTLAEDYPNMMARMGRRIPKDLCYEALRLARTEYSNAFMEGVYSRGRVNPSYQGVRFMLSDAHPEQDICDDLASADLYNMGPGVYPAGEEPVNPHPNCYSEDTEVYTNEGWRLFKDLHGDEQILSMNPETQIIEWVNFDKFVSYSYRGKMVQFKSNSYDLLVTPDHRMMAGTQRRWFITSSKNLLNWEGHAFKLPRTGVWVGEEPSDIEYGRLRFKPEVFCRFMGYYLADGCTTKRYNNCYQICIAKTGKGKQQIINDLKEMPIKVNAGQIPYMYNAGLGQELIKLGKSHEKYIPEQIKQLSPRLIRIFLNAFRFCDGNDKVSVWKEKNLESESSTYFTSSKQMADELGELIVKAGYYPSFYLQQGKGIEVEFKNGKYTMNHDLWRISQNRSKCAWYHRNEDKGLKRELVDYDGMVYDIQLERNHILWVRRNGKTAWSGNCLCYVIPSLVNTHDFIVQLKEWKNNPSRQPKIEKWYNEVY